MIDRDTVRVAGYNCIVLIDAFGFIVQPYADNLKSGWGSNYVIARKHFLERNGLEDS